MNSKFKITQKKIKYYLKNYSNLQQKIRERELSHILYAPSFIEWSTGEKTIEKQVLAITNDYKLQEMKFYKNSFDKYLPLLKSAPNKKYYSYLILRYIKQLPKEKIIKILKTKDLQNIENTIIEYLYSNLKEINYYGKYDYTKQNRNKN